MGFPFFPYIYSLLTHSHTRSLLSPSIYLASLLPAKDMYIMYVE